jgi:hypothetical protein
MRLTGFSFGELMKNSNDDLTVKYFERLAKNDNSNTGTKVSEKSRSNNIAPDAQPEMS